MELRNSKLTIGEEAAQARQDGKTVFVFLGQVGRAPGGGTGWLLPGRLGGYLPELSADLQAIQSAGWHLNQATWSAGKMVLFVFTA
jgi:hypothetical protein